MGRAARSRTAQPVCEASVLAFRCAAGSVRAFPSALAAPWSDPVRCRYAPQTARPSRPVEPSRGSRVTPGARGGRPGRCLLPLRRHFLASVRRCSAASWPSVSSSCRAAAASGRGAGTSILAAAHDTDPPLPNTKVPTERGRLQGPAARPGSGTEVFAEGSGLRADGGTPKPPGSCGSCPEVALRGLGCEGDTASCGAGTEEIGW